MSRPPAAWCRRLADAARRERRRRMATDIAAMIATTAALWALVAAVEFALSRI